MTRLHSFLQKLRREQQGSVLILTVFGIAIMIGLTGAGIDLGRQQLAKIKLQQATDAVAVAIASMPDTTTASEKEAAVQRYFNLNYPATYIGLPRPTVTCSPCDDTIEVRASLSVDPMFVGVIGVGTMEADGLTRVASQSSRTSADYDVVMVVDESGSTGAPAPGGGGTIMTVEKSALSDMVNAIVDGANPNVRFGLVGYTGYISNAYGLTSDRSQALGYLTNLQPRCHNYDHYGMEAGLNMATGNWTAFRASARTCPSDYTWTDRNVDVPGAATNRSDSKKLSDATHVVFLTDGYIMVEPPGPPYPNYPQFLASCSALKSAGVIVHTISFVSRSAGDESTLRQCASLDGDGNPRYYYAPDSATLRGILTNIGTQIKKIRIID